MRVTILGSGTLLPDAQRASAAHLVEDGAASLLLDCGAGVLQGLAKAERDWTALTHVAITHFHTDHFGALPALLWALYAAAPGRGRLTVIGPRGLEERMDALAHAFGPFVTRPGFPLEIVELDPLASLVRAGVEIRAHSTEHTSDSLAYRVEGSRSLGYTGDTAPTAGLSSFFKGVDLLIAECTSSDDAPREGHLTPASVAALARDASCGMVVITHAYRGYDPEHLAESVRVAGIPGRCLAGFDGLVIDLLETCPRSGDPESGRAPG